MVVVGAGPAGCAAAIVLARAGRHVVVVDKARFPRDKCCGDGLTTGALRRLEGLGLTPGAVPSWTPVADVWLRSPSDSVGHFPLPRGRGAFCAVARRADLDAALVALARRAGATVLEGHRLTGASAAKARGATVTVEVAVADAQHPIDSRYVIGADGMWSPLRKQLGVADEPGYLGEWHACRQYFADVTGPAATEMWVCFEEDLLPGYLWSFPLSGDRANVGLGVPRGDSWRGADLARLWSELLKRDHVRALLGPGARPEGPYRAWPIPARVGTSALSAAGGRALFVGDAARAADPMTGEGIAQALETGALAAAAVLRAGALRPWKAAAGYRRAVAGGLAVDNALAGVLARALAHPRSADGAIRLASSTPWTATHFARWMFEDTPRALPVTPWRWRRHGFSQPGAWAARPGSVA